METLRITMLQSPLSWEDADSNLKNFTGIMKKIRRGSTDIILLPEMFNTGFTMNAAAMAETMNGRTVEWMKQLAKEKKAVICGSIIITEKGKYFNRLIWMQPDGKILKYDKRHLFRMAAEHKTYTQGNKKLLVNYKGWKISPMVCYDLRFPVWSRSDGTVDLMLFIANWPEKRSYAWKQLLIARAIENQCFVAGLNRVGNDGKKFYYSGDSVLLDPLGQPVLDFVKDEEKIIRISIHKKQLEELRKVFPVAMDRDKFRILN